MPIHTDFSPFKSRPLVMVTAYDVAFAGAAEQAGVDIILVGDTLANVVLGKKRTSEIHMDTMKVFVEAVCTGARNTHIVADMPAGSYLTPESALKNAREFIQLGAHSVKFEGFYPQLAKSLTQAGIPVMAHLGLLPQTATSLKQVGNKSHDRETLLYQAVQMQQAGVFAQILEHLNFSLAREITQVLSIPTIGIGAGPHVNGQVLVIYDMLGIHNKPLPPFAKKFADVYAVALKGITQYAEAVKNGTFP